MTVHCIMIVRNEADRHLVRALESAASVAGYGGGKLIITDDASTDATREICARYTRTIQRFAAPVFWANESRARQAHLDYASLYMAEGDWVLSLDADETINNPELLVATAVEMPWRYEAIGLPLYEFWEPDQYRVDGYWFGTMTSRLFRWHSGARIRDKRMGCGSEPTYVAEAVQAGRWMKQTNVHLLHWGYVREEDRVRKHAAYMARLGGHGHNDAHVQSIVEPPRLARYP